jgi:integration host factor subunit beta
MRRADLIEEVSRVAEMTPEDAEVVVGTIFDSIMNSLRKGNRVELRRFGSFRTRQRQPRLGRNPRTGAAVDIPAKRILYFSPGKELKERVNNQLSIERVMDLSPPDQT